MGAAYYAENLRENLYSIMGSRRWGICKLAEQCHTSRRSITTALYGRGKEVNLITLSNISQGTGMSISELIGENR